MNASENISLLKQIKTNINDIDTNTLANKNELISIDNRLTTTNSHLNTISGNIVDIDTEIETISNNVSVIKTDVDTLAKTKVIFNARLTDGTNNYLARSDYSGEGNGIDFYWQNDKGTPVYIYKYVFTYEESTEPTGDQLYHSTAWDSKIGALNLDENDYEAPYITVSDNKDYVANISAGAPKNSWVTNTTFVFQKDFNEAPIEIGISRKFGHYINGDFDDTNLYDSDPVGIIEGFYLQ